ncbi:unnamed protein product [Microthlaspi erraticum]|uniref:Uncharacterized protein n=1 Tax=Microthlaspi erraticum TaxID=1685480 RepID=A0A6D2I4Z8_9BRAS|nr:unnamed protein product [Microthlaspi erraticum]
MDSSLHVIEVSRVTPSTTDSSESFTLPLTFFDLVWYKSPPVQLVIFYQLTDATRSFFDSVIFPTLKSSLSSTLSHYLPLAGLGYTGWISGGKDRREWWLCRSIKEKCFQ